ncbi:MAG TPA: hypothetical protein VGQ02_10875 [Candidatus Limnocylindrales bacterium]|jgi:hypothetical protein|nr:hypothetical protein [Candidatus Limnocylindrales bacterium]
MAFDADFDPEVTLFTREQRLAMNKRAREAAQRELRNDPNRKDPKHTQERMDAAVHKLRVRMGLERD